MKKVVELPTNRELYFDVTTSYQAMDKLIDYLAITSKKHSSQDIKLSRNGNLLYLLHIDFKGNELIYYIEV